MRNAPLLGNQGARRKGNDILAAALVLSPVRALVASGSRLQRADGALAFGMHAVRQMEIAMIVPAYGPHRRTSIYKMSPFLWYLQGLHSEFNTRRIFVAPWNRRRKPQRR